MQYKNLRPTQVLLDPENPRLPDGTSSDREAINRLLDEGAQAMINLARDIAQSGQTNPSELPIAVKDGSKYLVVEGNRRFAALKLLRDPALADDESHQKAFRRAAALGKPPSAVYTLIAPSRQEADHWLVLRHTGENNGVGVKRWSAGQTATHRKRANATVDSGTSRSITIADELEEAYAGDEELTSLVRRARKEKLTNIGRFFSPDVLTALHLSVESDTSSAMRSKSLYARHDADTLRDFFVWAFTFILDNSVDAYKNAEVRREALISARAVVPSLSDASESPFRLVDGPMGPAPAQSAEDDDEPTADDDAEEDATTEDEPASEQPGGGESGTNAGTANGSAGSPDPGGAPKKAEAKPERFLFQGLKLPNHPERIQRLLRECRSLEISASPGIACVMVRVIVELSVSSPSALNLSGAEEKNSLKDKIIAMLKHLDPDIEHSFKRDKELAQAFLEASDLGIQYLNGFVHNPSVNPDEHLARRFSQAFRPLLERVDRVV